jgi:hypothetical protein
MLIDVLNCKTFKFSKALTLLFFKIISAVNSCYTNLQNIFLIINKLEREHSLLRF